ncbi:hypothetical protein H0H92_007620 [Tricholoma furcatifolium]|nr:hypothetical protein H0H92_007620 [Tricholoma furcatifolium]
MDIYDDEVIPGSDEEENSMLQISEHDVQELPYENIPPMSTKDTIETALHPTIGTKFSSITSDFDSSSATRPRPKPRPVKKPNAASSTSEAPASVPNDYIDFDSGMPNIAERAKMRQRNVKSTTQQPILSSDIIELSSGDDDDFEILPSSKRRKVEKSKAKSTKKKKSSSEVGDSSELKPRPRPRPVKKTKEAESTTKASPTTARSSQSNPFPSSSLSNNVFPIPFGLVPSELPPSDPPASTPVADEHPRIEVLPQISPSTSSPHKSMAFNLDELDSDLDSLAGGLGTDAHLMPPPPLPAPPSTFFAGSSSPVQDKHSSESTSETKIRTSKKSRKKKPGADDDEAVARGTAKAKPKKKNTPAQEVEVVIEQRRTKGKGKQQESFKSREFIDDDDPLDSLAITAPVARQEPESLSSSTSVPESEDGNSNSRTSKKRKSISRDEDEALAAPKQHAKAKRRVVESDDEDIPDQSIQFSTPSQARSKAKSRTKPAAMDAEPQSSLFADDEIDNATYPNQQISNDHEPRSSASSKENVHPPPMTTIPETPKPITGPGSSMNHSLSSRRTMSLSTPMSDLIRRVNSKPGSLFCSPAPRSGGALPGTPNTAYSPYVKASRSALSRIAPLHPNRRTPPPPPPPPPPKKKTKKELEREEQWEEELIESVGGITEWACMTDAERREMRRAKREREMCGWED